MTGTISYVRRIHARGDRADATRVGRALAAGASFALALAPIAGCGGRKTAGPATQMASSSASSGGSVAEVSSAAGSLPSSSSSSASSSSSPAAPVGALLETPRRTDGTRLGEPCRRGDAHTYALHGDPRTRIVDAVWRQNACGEDDWLPVARMPVAMRLLDTALVDGHVYARVESVAFRGQPAGLRTFVDLEDGLATAIDAPADAEAAIALLPPVRADQAAVFSLGKLPPGRASGRWSVAGGISIEEVFQLTFRRPIGRLAPSDPRHARLADALASGRYACSRDWRAPESRGRCWGSVQGFDDVAFAAPKGEPDAPPLVRAVAVHAPMSRVLRPTEIEAEPDHRAVVEAYLARQPIAGTLLSVGPLNGDGGSSGIFLALSPKPRLYVVVVHGPAGALYVDGPLDDLTRRGLAPPTKVEAVIRGPAGQGGFFGSALLFVERPDEHPWAGIVDYPHPYRALKGPDLGTHETSLDGSYEERLRTVRSFREAQVMSSVPGPR